jgi:hypothetical protein
MTDPTIIVAAVGGGLALTGAILYAAATRERKRAEALADSALRMGFTFLAKVPAERLAALGDFHLFKRGHSGKARNLMEGKSGDLMVTLLDYQYTVGGGKDSHTYHQTVALFSGVGAGLPEFTLAPEHIWAKLGGLLGYQDIDFEASDEFSKRYLLRGPDESAIRAAFGAHLLGFFAQNLGWSVEAKSGALAVYRAGKRVKPEEMQAFSAEAAAVCRALGRT